MKLFITAMIGLFSAAATAANDGFVAFEPGMIRANHAIKVAANNLKGELACDLYKFRVENGGLKESTLLASGKIGITDIGTYKSGYVKFPAPYANYAVGFNHAMVSYAETDDGFLPYLQGFFLVDGIPDLVHYGSNANMRFSISDIQLDSKLILRGYLAAGSDGLLTFRCSMRFTQ